MPEPINNHEKFCRALPHQRCNTVAHAIQVGIEYDPRPPFDGNASRAPAQVMEILRPRYQPSRV